MNFGETLSDVRHPPLHPQKRKDYFRLVCFPLDIPFLQSTLAMISLLWAAIRRAKGTTENTCFFQPVNASGNLNLIAFSSVFLILTRTLEGDFRRRFSEISFFFRRGRLNAKTIWVKPFYNKELITL
ncbi:hypothetical protein CEXT_462291 [Caerostris extrusa]|uniref:Uncharacterized protein n=1 Tax=Caerostris extrusa TaxID=172846 RepID=A0AAV4RZK2_CAEEX|nr:hypothetical protein CEXT_462291 [Caerostris extrusa]